VPSVAAQLAPTSGALGGQKPGGGVGPLQVALGTIAVHQRPSWHWAMLQDPTPQSRSGLEHDLLAWGDSQSLGESLSLQPDAFTRPTVPSPTTSSERRSQFETRRAVTGESFLPMLSEFNTSNRAARKTCEQVHVSA
jgi:hypothetical protein